MRDCLTRMVTKNFNHSNGLRFYEQLVLSDVDILISSPSSSMRHTWLFSTLIHLQGIFKESALCMMSSVLFQCICHKYNKKITASVSHMHCQSLWKITTEVLFNGDSARFELTTIPTSCCQSLGVELPASLQPLESKLAATDLRGTTWLMRSQADTSSQSQKKPSACTSNRIGVQRFHLQPHSSRTSYVV